MAGVYQVDVALSKTQVAGDYNLDVLLGSGGLEVPTPAILIKPCTNTIAVGLGRVAAMGRINQLDTLEYTISDEQEIIELPEVRFYCEHEPV